MLAVTRTDVLVTLHILAVVLAFGGALAYPLWFRALRGATPDQRAFFHATQAWLGKFLITPAIIVVFGTGAYLASDFDLWSENWVILPTVILVVILVLGAGVLGPGEERLAHDARSGGRAQYERVFRRVRVVTWLLAVLVVAATYMMVAHVPD